jgi:hypothetical protein
MNVAFYIRTYMDYKLLYQCLLNLRKHYPSEMILVVSDGDLENFEVINRIAYNFGCYFIQRKNLHNIKDIIQSIHSIPHELESVGFYYDRVNYVMKLDTDTRCNRRIKDSEFILTPGIYGSYQYNGLFGSIQGGCIIFHVDVIKEFKYKIDSLNIRLKDFMPKVILDSRGREKPHEDHLIGLIAKKLGFDSFNLKCILSTYSHEYRDLIDNEAKRKVRPSGLESNKPEYKYAFTHPHKYDFELSSSVINFNEI